jgi:hypothetical protein
MQLAEQLPVQLASTDPLHPAVTLAVQLTGVQSAVQPPDVSTLHVRDDAPEKSMPPQAAIGAACAVRGTRARKPATTAGTNAMSKRRTIRLLLKTDRPGNPDGAASKRT